MTEFIDDCVSRPAAVGSDVRHTAVVAGGIAIHQRFHDVVVQVDVPLKLAAVLPGVCLRVGLHTVFKGEFILCNELRGFNNNLFNRQSNRGSTSYKMIV